MSPFEGALTAPSPDFADQCPIFDGISNRFFCRTTTIRQFCFAERIFSTSIFPLRAPYAQEIWMTMFSPAGGPITRWRGCGAEIG
jgi:hypothetical protein